MDRLTIRLRWPLVIALFAMCAWFDADTLAAGQVEDEMSERTEPPQARVEQAAGTRSARWFAQAPGGPMTGVALVVHGLNLNPDRMINIIRTLNASGIGALRVSLQGHGDNFTPIDGMDQAEARMEAFKAVSYHKWAGDLLPAYRHIRQLSSRKELPLFLVADSYGALLALALILTEADVQFDRMVLFAPALSMRSRNHIIRLLSPFPKWVWPSFAPKFYRANRGTPQAAYQVVFETLERFEGALGPKINIPTLVFIDPKDELISYPGLRKLKEKQKLDQWRFHHITKDRPTATTRIHHLIITPAAVGRSTWREMTQRMLDHFQIDGPLRMPYR